MSLLAAQGTDNKHVPTRAREQLGGGEIANYFPTPLMVAVFS